MGRTYFICRERRHRHIELQCAVGYRYKWSVLVKSCRLLKQLPIDVVHSDHIDNAWLHVQNQGKSEELLGLG
jgi:hypothetical protein